MGSVYSKASILLKSVTVGDVSSSSADNNWMVLHAACKIDVCPWSFCKFLLQLHPEQSMKKDKDGNLPIHIIASASNKVSDLNTIRCFACGHVEKNYFVQYKDASSCGW